MCIIILVTQNSNYTASTSGKLNTKYSFPSSSIKCALILTFSAAIGRPDGAENIAQSIKDRKKKTFVP